MGVDKNNQFPDAYFVVPIVVTLGIYMHKNALSHSPMGHFLIRV